MELLINAIDAIKLGGEDYRAGTHARLLSSVRNIHAGILPLYKEALRRLSPLGSGDVLMKATIVPKRDATGAVTFIGIGKKTADVRQIKARFEELGISTDWKRFDIINDARNDIEHYYTTSNAKTLQGIVANAFVLVRDFISTQLKDDPRKLLGEDTWQAMLAVTEVYAVERSECERLLKAVDWESDVLAEGVMDMSCTSCGSQLLRPQTAKVPYTNVRLKCRNCGAVSDADTFVPIAIETVLGYEAYSVVKDGGDTPYVDCPECAKAAYVIREQRCAFCGHEAEHVCKRCHNEIPAEELDSSPYCGWCAHAMSKDD